MTNIGQASLVAAAKAGDERARDDLLAAHLPLVYTIVRRALAGHPGGVDDVVQETMLRAMRQLPALREPDSFRAWLAAIAVRQAGTYLQRERTVSGRRVPLDELTDAPDADDFEDLTVLRVELSGQRRQVGQAVGWLDPEDRALWSLWWLEVGGELSRAELATALGVGVVHAGVRVQRMRERLEQARVLVAALDARPRCPWLDSVLADWDGIPSPLWRKRISRHTRSCVACTRAAEDAVDTEHLLSGFALLPVPGPLIGAFGGHDTAAGISAAAPPTAATGPAVAAASAKAGWLVGLPVAKLVVAGSLAAGVAVTVAVWPHTEAPSPPVAAPSVVPSSAGPSSPAPPPGLHTGPVSLELDAGPGRYLGTDGQLGVLVTPATVAARQRATFTAVPGLADAECYSFRAADGQYLRHASWRLRLDRDQGTSLFRGDATFCPLGTGTGDVMLEASNYRGYFIHRDGDELWVHQADGTAAFRAGSTFRVRPALS
ncbi:sigma-70 family RNA polymerase sigma factor [Dactylosporangium matsuzakiense]|uniref:sigma-70 family RNA polymerase sigma factor n=2 Tax=Dactylosporangium matsuzakiense TaxID=53360 RepID=UPI0021C40900|nr:sigma-70 family RNA polymerase sigma factor [Dactylosporangium matsuzakiense]UWZ49641.1 sigma-70 family RNA polymerase sigma factor [Dactylosporangium matsuzakiense]